MRNHALPPHFLQPLPQFFKSQNNTAPEYISGLRQLKSVRCFVKKLKACNPLNIIDGAVNGGTRNTKLCSRP